jgi:hypothetical protein
MKKKAAFASGAPPAAVLEWIRAPTELAEGKSKRGARVAGSLLLAARNDEIPCDWIVSHQMEP